MKKRIDLNYWLFQKPIAHRGLYSNENGIPENTKIAFDEAIKRDLPIEMDVQMSKDGVLFVFHDDNAKRVCGIDKDVREMNFDEISKMHPMNLEYTIFTFKDFLSYINGRVPLVIEVKNQKYPGIEQKVINDLKDYFGEFVIQSFNPIIMKNIHKLEPKYIIGVLTTRDYGDGTTKLNKFILTNFIFKLFVKPDFYNNRVEDLKKNYIHIKKYPIVCWTINDNSKIEIAEKYANNIIFEKTCTNLGKFTKNYIK